MARASGPRWEWPSERRLLRKGALLAVTAIGSLATLAACTEEPELIPDRNLDRPTDLGFACAQRVEVDGQARWTGRPMRVCHDPDPQLPVPGNETQTAPAPRLARADFATGVRNANHGTFLLATNSGRGEVALIDYNISRLIDLDPAAPGYNQVPVGTLPESIGVSSDGCLAATANHGSCDLSVIDVSALIARRFGGNATTGMAGTQIARQITVRSGGQPLRAQPREIAFLPNDPAMPPPVAAMCAANGPQEAVVTFPRCALIALVALPSGEIKGSFRVLSDGSAIDSGTNPVCPTECGAGNPGFPDGAIPPPPDAAVEAPAPVDPSAPEVAPDAGAAEVAEVAAEVAPPEPAPGPVVPTVLGGLAVNPDPRRLQAFVGLAAAPVVIGFDVLGTPGARRLSLSAALRRMTLAEGAIGVTRLRLSIDPYMKLDPNDGYFVGDRGKFLYAFVRDGSVRVLDIQPRIGGVDWQECDANVDPTARISDFRDNPCFPVGRHPRRLLVEGPGIRVSVSSDPEIAPPVPIDIAFAQNGPLASGLLLTSNAQVLHVGLGKSRFEGLGELVDAVATHWYRRLPSGIDERSGPRPFVANEPTRDFVGGAREVLVPFPTRIQFPGRYGGPRLESFLEGSESTTRRWAFFPLETDPVPPQRMAVVWQGPLAELPEHRRGRLEAAGGVSGNGALLDVGADFCRVGAQVGDIVALIGCGQDSDCNAGADQVCHRAAPGSGGVCIRRSFANDEARLRACRSEFGSRRRYEVKAVTAQRLELGLKLDEVPRPALTPCEVREPGREPDPVCQPEPSHRADPAIAGDVGFTCQPFAGGPPRCVKSCGVDRGGGITPEDALCRPGNVCANVGVGGETRYLCVEAPLPKAECETGDLDYDVRAGRSFLVLSESLRPPARARATTAGTCEAIPNLDRRLTNRISLDAPACNLPSPPPQLGELLSAAPPSANPCLFIAPVGDETNTTANHVKAYYENPYLRFVLTNLEVYVGDQARIEFEVLGGFSPLRVGTSQATPTVVLGVRLVTGPMASAPLPGADSNFVPVPPYFFLIDQGRTSRELSRGQIMLLNPRPEQNTYRGGIYEPNHRSRNDEPYARWPIQ